MINTCGSCTICCTALSIKEINKPEGVRCEHLTEQGCGIYNNRPEECRNYECGFLSYDLHRKLRPDRSGFIIGFADTRLGPSIVCYVHKEVSKFAKKLFNRIRMKFPHRPLFWRRGKMYYQD